MLYVVLHFLTIHLLLLWRFLRWISLFDRRFLCSFDYRLKSYLMQRYFVLIQFSHRYSHSQEQIFVFLALIHLYWVLMKPLIYEESQVDLSPTNLLSSAKFLLPWGISIQNYECFTLRVYFLSIISLFVSKFDVSRERHCWDLLIQDYHSMGEHPWIFTI